MFLLFLLPLIGILAYLFLSIRRVAAGKAGSIVALVLLSATLLCFVFRTSTIGFAGQAVFVVWIAETLTLFIGYDLFRLFRHIWYRGKKKHKALESRIVLAISFLLTAIFLVYGVPHNQNFVLRKATVELNATGDSTRQEPFSILYFSDLHIDPLFQKSKLERLAGIADSLKPTYIVFGGDLADISDKDMSEKGFDPIFKKLTSVAPSFGVVGNHEAYMERSGSNPEGWMQKNGMTVLSDNMACTDKICLSGRVDFQVARSRDIPRRPLREFSIETACKADSSNCHKPWILIDHQPKGIESEYSGPRPDISLSGHTHDGQFFPVTAIIDLFWRLSYGFGELDGFKWLVTSGIDTWGPPVRVGSDAEVWFLEFKNP